MKQTLNAIFRKDEKRFKMWLDLFTPFWIIPVIIIYIGLNILMAIREQELYDHGKSYH